MNRVISEVLPTGRWELGSACDGAIGGFPEGRLTALFTQKDQPGVENQYKTTLGAPRRWFRGIGEILCNILELLQGIGIGGCVGLGRHDVYGSGRTKRGNRRGWKDTNGRI